jgi:serine/threonine-protein kinase
LYAVVHTMPPKPSELADIPPQLDDVLAVGLAKDPEQRFATTEELSGALAAAAHGELSPQIARRAREAVAAHPWGATAP